MVTISVIMPFYNSREYLEESVASILNQTFTDFELILLNDGSTDFPEDVINNFVDSRIRYYRDNENKGIIYQLNKGIDLAQGKFIARMDADDISFPERFQQQVDFLEDPKNSKIDVLGTNAIKIGDEVGVMDYKNYKPQQISFLLNFGCYILHPSVMMQKSIFDDGLRYSEDYKYAEDYALWRSLDNGRNIAILPIPLLAYRIHGTQTNKVTKRLKIQLESGVKVNNLRSPRIFDNLFISKRLKLKLTRINSGFLDSYHASLVEKNYIKLIKKMLSIKNHSLNTI